MEWVHKRYNMKTEQNENRCGMKSATWKKCNTEKVQHEMSATRKKCYSKNNAKRPTQKNSIRKVCNTKKCNLERVRYEKSAKRKNYNKKWVQDKKVQHEVSATWSKTKQGPTWKNHNMKKVQHFKRFNMKRVQDQKRATRKNCNPKRVQHKKLQHRKSVTWKECNLQLLCWEVFSKLCGKRPFFLRSETFFIRTYLHIHIWEHFEKALN